MDLNNAATSNTVAAPTNEHPSTSGASPRGYTSLQLTPDRWDDIVDIDEWAFLNPWLPEERVAVKKSFEWDRGFGFEVADAALGKPGALVAMRCSYPFTMMVPGGERVPTSGLSWVGVHPGHRRRGLLTAMIREHFEHALERGEYVSALTASEPKIYQRYGYGLATWHMRAMFGRGSELRPIAGSDALTVRLERLTLEDHADLMADLQRQSPRPGAIVREGDAITANLFANDADERPQEERMRIAIVSAGDGSPQAFAVFRRKSGSHIDSASGEVFVLNYITTTAASAHRLWSVLFDLDLTAQVTVTSLPVDDRLVWLATDQRAPKSVVEDDLWIRILDVPRALTARTYEAAVDMVVRVTDKQIGYNTGLWRVTTEPMRSDDLDDDADAGEDGDGDAPEADGGQLSATVTRVTDGLADGTEVADLTIDIQELSAAYLGGVSIQTLADAGLIAEHTPGAARLLSLAMLSPVAPASTFHF
jgi:predicted acetyltransferase